MTESQSLYAPREPIFPRRVSGFYRRLKWWIMGVTLAIYYLTPWIRWDRGPGLPDQAVLVDMANRRFYFFWIEIWPHEFYFVAGLLVMAGLGLFLFTAALGRVWCGYACPQTVWTDLFILVERWIEGDRNARIRLQRAPWDARKWRLRLSKWTTWLLIAVATGGAWVFYFADAPTLARDLATLQAPPVAWITIGILTATTFTLGGFMREQVCIYMCPWPRIQGAMMDDDTLTVAYRDWRGEPRGKGNVRRRTQAEAMRAEALTHAAGEGQARYKATPYPSLPTGLSETPVRDGPGDCIDCNACVNVCPMGIDIREGQQLACITCALCIDACDEVMEKIGKPRGLIDYIALSDAPRERAGKPPIPAWRHVVRPRNILYTVLWAGIGIALVVALFIRPEIGLTVSPVRNPTHVVLSDGAVRNAYTVRLRNMEGEPRTFRLAVDGSASVGLSVEGADDATVRLPADTQREVRVYLTAPAATPAAQGETTPVEIWIEDLTDRERASTETVFTGRGG